jgi:hypothetical protein
MKYVVEMGSGAMMHKCIKIGSAIQKFMGGGYTEAETAQ